jgi:hypothetical protein
MRRKWPAFGERSVLAFGGVSSKLPTEVGERLRQRAMGGRGTRVFVRGIFGGTKPTHVDPGFAADRDRFRLEWEGEFLLCLAVEGKAHLFMSSVTIDHFTALPPCRLFPNSRSAASPRNAWGSVERSMVPHHRSCSVNCAPILLHCTSKGDATRIIDVNRVRQCGYRIDCEGESFSHTDSVKRKPVSGRGQGCISTCRGTVKKNRPETSEGLRRAVARTLPHLLVEPVRQGC